jgi:hypothetical protein
MLLTINPVEREILLDALCFEEQFRESLQPAQRLQRRALALKIHGGARGEERRPGDFADDGCGDPSLSPVPGMAC